jgi:CubicO group peptidase (beta-lactamase class C family)
VSKHLRWFQLPDPYLTAHVTVRDALRHSSGLANTDLLWAREDLTTREILERMRFAPTNGSLRSSWEYQNVMYQAAGEVVAAASGMPWDRFITTRVLEPLGMSRSYATYEAVAALKDPNTSVPHFEIDGDVRVIDDMPVDRVPAAGSAWTTARDAGKWLAFLLAGGQAGGRRLVSEANFRELLAPQTIAPPMYPTAGLVGSHWLTYGLGWFQQDYRGHAVDYHTGSIDGMVAIAGLVRDEGLGVVVLSNLDHMEARHALMFRAFDTFLGREPRDWSADVQALYRRQAEEQQAAVRRMYAVIVSESCR